MNPKFKNMNLYTAFPYIGKHILENRGTLTYVTLNGENKLAEQGFNYLFVSMLTTLSRILKTSPRRE